MAKAYLVLRLDVTQNPPVVAGCGIYGESWQTLTLDHNTKWAYVDALSSPECNSWEQAQSALRSEMMFESQWRWALRWIDGKGSPA